MTRTRPPLPRAGRRRRRAVRGRPALASAAAPAQTPGRPPGAGRYDYLGRTPGYRDWAVVPRGLTVKSIETFQRDSLALVRITASDGKIGWGQIAPYEADISAEVLHRLIARLVIGRDISEIDAINDAVIDAQLKFPWSFLCRALAGVDTALWDLYGQITGKPVAVLLGGSVRPLPAYGSSMRRDISPADEATRLARLRDTFGCKAFKIRLGTPGGRNQRRRARPQRGDHPGGAQGGRARHRAACRREQLLHARRRDRDGTPPRGRPLRRVRGAVPVLGARVDAGSDARARRSTSRAASRTTTWPSCAA